MTPVSVSGIPDVTGYTVEIAVNALREAGIGDVKVVSTSAPFRKQAGSESDSSPVSRVLRQKLLDGGKAIELVIFRF